MGRRGCLRYLRRNFHYLCPWYQLCISSSKVFSTLKFFVRNQKVCSTLLLMLLCSLWNASWKEKKKKRTNRPRGVNARHGGCPGDGRHHSFMQASMKECGLIINNSTWSRNQMPVTVWKWNPHMNLVPWLSITVDIKRSTDGRFLLCINV